MTFIAELGLNAHGDLEKMYRMCEKAAKAGATYIKGQFYNPYSLLGKEHPALQDALKSQFTRKEHEEIATFCESLAIPYFISVFDLGDVAWANNFCSVHKIASRMNVNQEFIAKIEATKKPVFMSVQPSNQGQRIPDRFKLMWCIRDYPTSKENLLQYPYSKHFGVSSHCPDISATAEAIKRGATIVEHHVCESREEEGCDISSSITFDELQTLIHQTSSLAH